MLCALTGDAPRREAVRPAHARQVRHTEAGLGLRKPTRAPRRETRREKLWISVAPGHCREPQTYVAQRSEPLPAPRGFRQMAVLPCSPRIFLTSPGLLTYRLMLSEYSDDSKTTRLS